MVIISRVSYRTRRLVVLGTSLSAAVMTLDTTVVNVALPAIGAAFDASLPQLQWIVNAYTLVFAALLLTAGSLSDRWGRRRMFLCGMAAFTLASVLCTIAWDAASLIVFRALQGVGAACVMGSGLALITEVHEERPSEERQKAIGTFTAFGAAAAAFGPLLGGTMVSLVGWRGIFAVNIILGVVTVALVRAARVPPRPHVTEHRWDPTGALLAVLMLLSANYALLAGSVGGWTRPDVLAGLVAAPVLLIAFVIVEARLGRAAMLDLSLLRIPTFSAALGISFTSRIATFGLLASLILWLTGPLGLSPFLTGLILVTQSLVMMFAAGMSTKLAEKLAVRHLIFLGMLLGAAGLLPAALTVDANSGWLTILPTVLLLGFGSGLVMPHLMGLAVGVVPPHRAGMATGASNTFLPLGTGVGVALHGVILSWVIASHISDPHRAQEIAAGRMPDGSAALDAAREAFAAGMSAVFWVACAACVLSAVIALVAVRRQDMLVTE